MDETCAMCTIKLSESKYSTFDFDIDKMLPQARPCFGFCPGSFLVLQNTIIAIKRY